MGWENLKSVYRKVLNAEDREAAIQSLNEDGQRLIEWFEEKCINGDNAGLDPNHWSMDDVNAQLASEL